MGTMTNNEDPGLHCLLRQNQYSEKEIQIFFFQILTRDPSIYTMGHPDLIVCGFMDNSIGLKRVR